MEYNQARRNKAMRKIIIHRSDPDEEVPYWVECPSLGIASMGESIDDAIRMIHEAIELHIEDLIAHGEPVPPEDAESLPDQQFLVLDV
jgi:predicted RNase H-like HicB family nuclease